jgi:hypothetical protein
LKTGPGDQELVVGRPLATPGQHGVSRLRDSLAEQPDACGEPAAWGVRVDRVVERRAARVGGR